MLFQIFSIVMCLELVLIEGNYLTKTCHRNECVNGILEVAMDLIKKESNLNKKFDEENGAKCILDIALDLIAKAKGITLETVDCEGDFQPVDCEDLLAAGFNKSGNYTIWPKSRVGRGKSVAVYCDMKTDGGGWTVIQRRGDFGSPEDYFYKGWSSYKSGFGDIKKDFWLGNDNIFAITNQKLYSVRFDLKAYDGEKRYALYDIFWIEDEMRNYTLRISNYSGDAGDSLTFHNNRQFSTKDVDNDLYEDSHCGSKYKGGWWYANCHRINLNGMDRRKKDANDQDGLSWGDFKGTFESLDTTEIKVRSKLSENP